MHFETIYDLQRDGVQNWYVPFFALVFAAGGWRHWLKCQTPGNLPAPGQPGTREAFGAMIFGVMLSLAAAVTVWGQYIYVRVELDRGEARVDEGAISAFHAATKPRDPDSFVLNGETFTYRTTWMTQGFQWMHRNGSPVADGLHVRVTHIGDRITKFEIDRG